MVLVVPFAATLSDASLRRERYVALGLIISGLGGFLLLFSESFLVLFAVVFLLGLGQALSIAAQSALVGEHCQEEIRQYGADAVYGVYRFLERLGGLEIARERQAVRDDRRFERHHRPARVARRAHLGAERERAHVRCGSAR